MIVRVSGFGKRVQSRGVGRNGANRTNRAVPDEMADGKWCRGRCGGRAGRITIKIMIKIKSCRFRSKAPEKTGAVQKLRRFVAIWRGRGREWTEIHIGSLGH